MPREVFKTNFISIGLKLFAVLFPFGMLYAQSNRVDSLQKVLNQVQVYRQRVNIQNELSKELRNNNLEQALQYARNAFELAKQINFTEGEADGLNNIGA